jgi:hypothetical protein
VCFDVVRCGKCPVLSSLLHLPWDGSGLWVCKCPVSLLIRLRFSSPPAPPAPSVRPVSRAIFYFSPKKSLRKIPGSRGLSCFQTTGKLGSARESESSIVRFFFGGGLPTLARGGGGSEQTLNFSSSSSFSCVSLLFLCSLCSLSLALAVSGVWLLIASHIAFPIAGELCKRPGFPLFCWARVFGV